MFVRKDKRLKMNNQSVFIIKLYKEKRKFNKNKEEKK